MITHYDKVINDYIEASKRLSKGKIQNKNRQQEYQVRILSHLFLFRKLFKRIITDPSTGSLQGKTMNTEL